MINVRVLGLGLVVGLGLGLIIPTCRSNLVLRVIWQCDIFGMMPAMSVGGIPPLTLSCHYRHGWLLYVLYVISTYIYWCQCHSQTTTGFDCQQISIITINCCMKIQNLSTPFITNRPDSDLAVQETKKITESARSSFLWIVLTLPSSCMYSTSAQLLLHRTIKWFSEVNFSHHSTTGIVTGI